MKLYGAVLLLLTSMASSLASAQEIPVIVNSQTGASVELTRAYWDPNNDIANRVMQCDFYVFNVESQVYEHVYEDDSEFDGRWRADPWYRSRPHYHLQLPRFPAPVNSAFIGTDPVNYSGKYLPLWSVIDGVYDGPAPLGESRFVEIVAHRSDTRNAVRVWHNSESFRYPDSPGLDSVRAGHAAFSVCNDPTGTPMVPTGQPSVSPQLAEPIDDLIVTLAGLGDHTGETPVIVDRETGLTIEFSTGRWNYNQDIALRKISCATYWRIDSEGGYVYGDFPNNLQQYWYHPYNGGNSILVTHLGSDGYPMTSSSLSIENLPEFFSSGNFLELTNEASPFQFRLWDESSEGESFRGCSVDLIGMGHRLGNEYNIPDLEFGPSLPLEINDTQNGGTSDAGAAGSECDYTNAADYDGWGWNPVTMSSCPPQTDDNSVDETTGVNNGIDVTDDTGASNNTQTNPDSSGEDGTNETTSEPPAVTTSQSRGGGGTVWLPLLIIVLASRHLAIPIQPQN